MPFKTPITLFAKTEKKLYEAQKDTDNHINLKQKEQSGKKITT